MRKLFILLFIAGLSLTSCEKDETVEAKDYTTYTETLNLNSTDGILPPGYTPPSDGRPSKNPYFFSTQYSIKLSSNDNSVKVVSNESDYQNLVIGVNTETDLVDVLPKEGDWHLIFTEYYTEELFGQTDWYQMYLVGVLANKGISTVNIASDKFEDITLADAKNEEFTDKVDNIGTKWQEYNRGLKKYIIIDEASTYLVKVSDDEIYKLRFMDFYGDGVEKGEKGHITFQYELLK